MHSYAQHGDDLILVALLDSIGIARPSYLDIGAGDPMRISNTMLLYERGSRGINVDANPALIGELSRLRPEDINLNCGVGAERGRALFYRVDANPDLSSFDPAMAFCHGPCSPIEVDIWTVSDIVTAHADGVFPDLLSIDIEGMDLEVLNESIHLGRCSPKVICAELIAVGSDRTPDFVSLLNSRGYSLNCIAGANGIFIGDNA